MSNEHKFVIDYLTKLEPEWYHKTSYGNLKIIIQSFLDFLVLYKKCQACMVRIEDEDGEWIVYFQLMNSTSIYQHKLFKNDMG